VTARIYFVFNYNYILKILLNKYNDITLKFGVDQELSIKRSFNKNPFSFN